MKKIILILLFILITACPCLAKGNPKREVKKGNTLYDKGRFEESLEHYEKASSAEPNSGIVNHNIGTASYKLKDYEKAVNFFNRALTDEEEELAQQTSYNLANSEYMLGMSKEDSNLREAVNLLTQSVRHYDKALELDKEDKDAIFNYEYVKKELERLKLKLQQQDKVQPQSEDKKEQKSQSDKQQDQQQQQEQDKKDKQKQEKDQQEQKKEQEQEKDRQQQDKEEQEKDQQEKDRQEQDKDQEPQEKDQQDKQQGEGQEPGQEDSQTNPGERPPQEEMSEKQASMLLDNYHYDEEPKGLYKQKIKTQGMPDVDKDW